MPVLTQLPAVPDKPRRLREFALGPLLHQWSDQFTPDMLSTASSALQLVRDLVESASRKLSSLREAEAAGVFDRAELESEELRLTILLERQVAMLERLGVFHQRATSVSAAALLHAMTRGILAGPAMHDQRNVTPVRTLGSATDQLSRS